MVWLRPTACLPALARASLLLVALLVVAGCARSSGLELVRVEARGVAEADGLPAHVHPAADIRHWPDDPRQPFSPQYGSLPPSPRAGEADAVASLDAEAIIAAAITAHEMRKP